jgi:hypothetical protein
MLLPQEVAEQLTPDERMDLVAKIEELHSQAFSVIKVRRVEGKVIVEVELDDRTRHDVVINSDKNVQ